MRKPRFKKDVTCLRRKGQQYHELTEALDLLLDGPSANDTKMLRDLSLNGANLELPAKYKTSRNRGGAMGHSMQPSNMTSPMAGAGN